MLYITAIRNDGTDPFNIKAKDMHVTIECSSFIAAMHVFYLITGMKKYSKVVLSSDKPITIDTNMYDVDAMNSDEFLLMEL